MLMLGQGGGSLIISIRGWISSLVERASRLSMEDIAIFGGAMLVVFALVTYYVARNYDRMLFDLKIWIKSFYEGGKRRKIFYFMQKKRIGITIMLEDGTVAGEGTICRVKPETLDIAVQTDRNMSRLARGMKVVCSYRQIWFLYERSNSFDSYCTAISRPEDGPPVVRVKIPVAVKNISRRRHKRYRVKTQRTIMARVWFEAPKARGGKIMLSQPAFEVNVNYHVSHYNTERVFDVSRHGIRLGVHVNMLKGKQPSVGREVCVQVKPFVHQDKRFDSFLFGGKIRHIYTTPKHMVVMGIEFLQVGRRSGHADRVDYSWEPASQSKIPGSFAWAVKQLTKK